MGLMSSLRSKLELYRLEQRYTRREKRTTFSSGAQYVDGEYVYPTTSSTPSSANSSAMATPETETPPAFSPASVSSARFEANSSQSSPTMERREEEVERSERSERPAFGRSDSFASWSVGKRRDGFMNMRMD
ncbi:hypothetical protein MBLNU457_7328t1 [Dothideomycetes sp. NU457]